MRTVGLLTYSAAVLATGLAWSPTGQPDVTPPYPGGLSPGPVAVVFAPGIVSGPDKEYALAVDRGWTRVVFTRAVGDRPVLFEMDRVGGVWTPPVVAPFSGGQADSHPFFSPDGGTLYFSSRRPRRGSAGGMALWFVERRGDGWSAPQPFEPLADQSLHAPAMAADGSIVSSGLLFTRYPPGEDIWWVSADIVRAVRRPGGGGLP